MEFVAIDFETANHRRDSACQLAAVVVDRGEIVQRHCWMIRPRPFWFSPRNIDVHGIRPLDVEHEPEFGELWPSICAALGDHCVVAHNAAFDIGVLKACLQSYGLTIPRLSFTCTRLIGRAAWPGMSGYGLKQIANRLGIQFRHHDALEDSIACAKILLAAASLVEATSLSELENRFRLSRGCADAVSYQGPRRGSSGRAAITHRRSLGMPSTSRFARQGVAAPEDSSLTIDDTRCESPQIDWHRMMIRAGFMQSLRGKQVLICGECRHMTPDQAISLARGLGATRCDYRENATGDGSGALMTKAGHQDDLPESFRNDDAFVRDSSNAYDADRMSALQRLTEDELLKLF